MFPDLGKISTGLGPAVTTEAVWDLGEPQIAPPIDGSVRVRQLAQTTAQCTIARRRWRVATGERSAAVGGIYLPGPGGDSSIGSVNPQLLILRAVLEIVASWATTVSVGK